MGCCWGPVGNGVALLVGSAHTTWFCPPATKHPEEACAPTQFRCVSTNTCIPASFHCDEESDCPDRSDEFGCSEQGAGADGAGPLGPFLPAWPFGPLIPAPTSPVPPQVVTPPQETIQASRGQTVTFTCVAIGVPTPIINWRLNWGHIPSHPRFGSGLSRGCCEAGRALAGGPGVTDQCLWAHQGDHDQ